MPTKKENKHYYYININTVCVALPPRTKETVYTMSPPPLPAVYVIRERRKEREETLSLERESSSINRQRQTHKNITRF